jgi:hypothetical protein
MYKLGSLQWTSKEKCQNLYSIIKAPKPKHPTVIKNHSQIET